MANAKLKRIEGLKVKIQQLENLQKEIMQEYKEDLRKERTHRICKRGGMVEKHLPETIHFTDEQMKELFELLLNNNYAHKMVAKVKGKNNEPAKPSVEKNESVKTEELVADISNEAEEETNESESEIYDAVELESDDDVSPYS